MRLPLVLAAAAAALTLQPGCAVAQSTYGDAQYRPESGQAGKDVIWVPTPAGLVTAMLKAANVGPSDYVVDLGSGDGRIAIAAAKEFGARAKGIEYNPEMVSLANREARRQGVADRVTFERGDIFKSDFSKANVVTLYLLPDLNLRLRPTILRMRPGTRVVSNSFTMGEWDADQTIRADGGTGYLWIVPARVAGTWRVSAGGRTQEVTVEQRFQMLSGRGLREGRVRGDEVTLVLADGTRLVGTMGENGISGKGWTATRA